MLQFRPFYPPCLWWPSSAFWCLFQTVQEPWKKESNFCKFTLRGDKITEDIRSFESQPSPHLAIVPKTWQSSSGCTRGCSLEPGGQIPGQQRSTTNYEGKIVQKSKGSQYTVTRVTCNFCMCTAAGRVRTVNTLPWWHRLRWMRTSQHFTLGFAF